MTAATFAVAATVLSLTLGTPSPVSIQVPATQRGKTAAPTAGTARKNDLSKYPAAVRATIEAETKNATLKHVSKETEKGRTQYEVETMVNGNSRDLLVDPTGKVIEVEEQILLNAAPAAVQDALKTRGTVLKIERVVRGATTSYEASVQGKNGKKAEVALDSEGKPVKG